ncbi:MAG: rRNA pseudouridine synthase [Proteobacteria bacterium]|nr:rRNA pseudouridine synthase [Desulfobacteraceae bacterium]MBU3980303.1 rRNA pseudouridine synthase [Pseudomonadota bacterium]MBU4014232.1 rRNA pseudouridine synthase [Pseudomonadota bacterium]MBU4067959.1 rRNA pseudouridine synthase [Pseudomonadota bacterium]MBU4101023.1 rRNA pseudouridine synthase [Pseudomonadota bacterium]
MPLMRLQKFLSSAGFCSRRKAEEYIKDGHVKVNGEVVSVLGTKIDPETDRVEVKGKLVEAKHDLIYIALNKPRGYVASCSQKGDKIVLDLINIQDRVYPVGRLDKDSTGLLLLTNDGELHLRLSHPSFDHEKEYEVVVVTPISDGALRKMAQGMPMMGTKTRPADVKRISAKVFSIILKEGKNKQIRRMVRKMGNNVVRLKRIRISNIKLGNLPEGSWRYLTEEEKQELL